MSRLGSRNERGKENGTQDWPAVVGFMYAERLKTFHKVWPFAKSSDICNPHNLAMAGLVCETGRPKLTVRCYVCRKRIQDLESHSDPWEMHAKVNPRCSVIQIGRPENPDGYTLEQVWKLVEEAIKAQEYEEYGRWDQEVKNMLSTLNN